VSESTENGESDVIARDSCIEGDLVGDIRACATPGIGYQQVDVWPSMMGP
jgi:hypothetical protein